jgi:hypothetical protein
VNRAPNVRSITATASAARSATYARSPSIATRPGSEWAGTGTMRRSSSALRSTTYTASRSGIRGDGSAAVFSDRERAARDRRPVAMLGRRHHRS